MKVTLDELVKNLKAFALSYDFVNSFAFGDPNEILNGDALEYPIMIVTPRPSRLSNKNVDMTLAFILADRYSLDDPYQMTHAQSDMVLVASDIRALMRRPDWREYIRVSESNPIDPFIHRFQDISAGWVMTMTFEIDDYMDFCQIPGDGSFDPGAGCDPARVVNSDGSFIEEYPSGQTSALPDITITDSDGSEVQYPSVKDFVCAPFEDATININSEEVATAGSGETVDLNVTLNGEASGSWNGGTNTWEVTADLPPMLAPGTYIPTNDGSGGLTWVGATANVTTGVGTISKNSGAGAWDGSAYSLVNHYGNFELFFNVTSGDEAMLGISYYKARPGFENLDIAFYCSLGNSFAWENGANKGAFGAFNSATLFSIQRSGSDMHYKVDGAIVRTVPVTNVGPVNIDTSIYDLSTISNIQLIIP